MLEIVVIGIGTGNPEHMTVEAIGALNAADLVLIPRKGAAKADLAELRRAICDRYLDEPRDPDRRVRHAAPRRRRPATARASRPGTARSPAVYRRLLDGRRRHAWRCWSGATRRSTTARCASSTTSRPAGSPSRRRVVPGITSLQVLAARHGIALNAIGGPVHVTTGRRLREARAGGRLDRGDARRRLRLPRGAGGGLRHLLGRLPRDGRRRSSSPGRSPRSATASSSSARRRGRRTAGSWTSICSGGAERRYAASCFTAGSGAGTTVRR